MLKKVFQLLEKVFSCLPFHRKPGFHSFCVISMFQRIQLVQLLQLVFLVMQWLYVCSLKHAQIESPYMVSRWSFTFTRKSLEDVLRLLKDVLKTYPEGRLGEVLKKGHHDFHFRLIYNVFGIKSKTFLRCLCEVFVATGLKLIIKLVFIVSPVLQC